RRPARVELETGHSPPHRRTQPAPAYHSQPSPLLLTIWLAMKPAINPGATQPTIDTTPPFGSRWPRPTVAPRPCPGHRPRDHIVSAVPTVMPASDPPPRESGSVPSKERSRRVDFKVLPGCCDHKMRPSSPGSMPICVCHAVLGRQRLECRTYL